MSFVLCYFAAFLLSLSGLNDTSKFLDEAAATFKMFEKSDSSKSSTKEDEKKDEKAKQSDSNDLSSKDDTKKDKLASSDDESKESTKKGTISEKIENIGKGYKKIVLNPLRLPSQLQKLLYATVKPISEFLTAGYIAAGKGFKDTEADKWAGYFGGKFDDRFLGLKN